MKLLFYLFNHHLLQCHSKNQMPFRRQRTTTYQIQPARRRISSNGSTTMNVMEIRWLWYDKCSLCEMRNSSASVCRTSFQTSRIISSLGYLGDHMMAMKLITQKTTGIQLSSATIPYTGTRSFESTTLHMISGNHKIQSTHELIPISCFSRMIMNPIRIGMHM